MKTERIYAGKLEREEKEAWIKQMKQDGFTNLWTWMCWVIRQYIKRQTNDETKI